MTELTKKVQECSIHDCKRKCYAISEGDAKRAINEVKKAIKTELNDYWDMAEIEPDATYADGFADALNIIESVK